MLKRKSDAVTSDNVRDKVRKSQEEPPANGEKDEDEETEDKENDVAHRHQDGSDNGGGELIYSGILDFQASKGKATDTTVWQFSRLSALRGIPVSFVASSSTSVHSVIVTTTGDVYTWGRGEKGQLGIGKCAPQVAEPTLVIGMKNHRVTGAATGSAHTLLLTSSGDVYGFGANNSGQLGIGTFAAVVEEPNRMLSKKIFVKISCGSDFSMIVDSKGNLYSCGYTENGRLGHGNPQEVLEGQQGSIFECENRARRLLRFVVKDPKSKTTKNLEAVKIKDVKCGAHHTIALDDRGRVFTWGFGGYGRLGHGSPADEVYPRLVNTFLGERRTAIDVWAGGSFCFAVSETDAFFFWGQLSTGKDSVMYPKTVDSMKKKKIVSIGTSSCSVLVHADGELFAWSGGPTLGQMGLGVERKSSSSASEVPLPAGVRIMSLTSGHSFSMAVAQTQTKEDREILESLPLVDLAR